MITLEIVEEVPSYIRPSFSLDGSYMISGLSCVVRYTERPDGTWYCLTYKRGCGILESIMVLVQSGLEPYRAFEVIAL